MKSRYTGWVFVITVISILVVMFNISVWASPASLKTKPNIVFILADDMGFDSVSANNPKIGAMKTPHLDRLISQGMNFTDAHSGSSVCTPTRYGLLTGRYCWRTPLKKEVLWTWGAPLIDKDQLTVAQLLKSKGYHTGMVGKWHLGINWSDSKGQIVNVLNKDLFITDRHFGKDPEPIARLKAIEKKIDFTQPISGGPTDCGFDYYFGVDVPNFPPYVWIENNQLQGIPSVNKPKGMFGASGPMLPGWKLEEVLPMLARKGREWIAEQSKTDEPFFLYLSLTSPHTPVAPSKAFKGISGISDYVDFVIETDWVVGHIMEALDTAKVAGNTLLIFSTDNGTSPASKFEILEENGIDLHNHLKGHKGSIDEGGHRVPFVARWPSKIAPASTCDELVGLTDFTATVAELLGVALPDNAAQDSYSVLPLLTGEKKSLPKRPLVVNHAYAGAFAIRDGHWKLVLSKPPKLFDLSEDLKETTNVADKYPERVASMAKTLRQYQESGRSR